MIYEELHRRYGALVSQRLKHELLASEFNRLAVTDLCQWLQERAESAHHVYRTLLNNPLAASEQDHQSAAIACRRWREAEDLAYLVYVAEDVGTTARAS